MWDTTNIDEPRIVRISFHNISQWDTMTQEQAGNYSNETTPLLGCIADDFTGATDLAGILVKNGMRTSVMIGVPAGRCEGGNDAIVIALRSRSAPRSDAVQSSVAALRWLRQTPCRQFFFKYCSTFDSTDQGNIGPVAEALMEELGADFTIACPAFPANGRSIYNGYLFVNGVLLHESGMRDHPLNPMKDSNLVRVLQRQSRRKVGLIDYQSVRSGASSIRSAVHAGRGKGMGLAIVDAVSDADLCEIASACQDFPLVTGGSGLAIGLPETFRIRGLLTSGCNAGALQPVEGFSAVISGSCSTATQRQVAWMKQRMPAFQIDPLTLVSVANIAAQAIEWAASRMAAGPILFYATADAESVGEIQAQLGIERAGSLVESVLAEISRQLVDRGVRRLIVAGGETSGAVLNALGVTGLRIGREIDPGVPWTTSLGKTRLALALKSGNFGSEDFFIKAWGQLP